MRPRERAQWCSNLNIDQRTMCDNVELGVTTATTPYEHQVSGAERPDGRHTIRLPKSKPRAAMTYAL